jgi:hypothetical protein
MKDEGKIKHHIWTMDWVTALDLHHKHELISEIAELVPESECRGICIKLGCHSRWIDEYSLQVEGIRTRACGIEFW